MSELPLIFFTALMIVALVTGQGRGAKASRLAALIVASACLGLWAYGLLTYEGGEGALAPLVDNFYATEYLQTQLGPLWSGVLVGVLALGPLLYAFLDLRRR